jgi:hypothetical protein
MNEFEGLITVETTVPNLSIYIDKEERFNPSEIERMEQGYTLALDRFKKSHDLRKLGANIQPSCNIVLTSNREGHFRSLYMHPGAVDLLDSSVTGYVNPAHAVFVRTLMANGRVFPSLVEGLAYRFTQLQLPEILGISGVTLRAIMPKWLEDAYPAAMASPQGIAWLRERASQTILPTLGEIAQGHPFAKEHVSSAKNIAHQYAAQMAFALGTEICEKRRITTYKPLTGVAFAVQRVGTLKEHLRDFLELEGIDITLVEERLRERILGA